MHLRRAVAAMIVTAACDPAADRDGGTDAALESAVDALQNCAPVAPPPGPACLSLAPGALNGGTPFGTLDMDLTDFAAGDCITISQATIVWQSSECGTLHLSFSYPVTADMTSRHVTAGGFDREARFEMRLPNDAPQSVTTMVHVDVTTWREDPQQGAHDIDIVLTFMDPAFSVAPIHVNGTFCYWPYYVC